MTNTAHVRCIHCGTQPSNDPDSTIPVQGPNGGVAATWTCTGCGGTWTTFTPDPAAAELQQLRRWVLAVTLGRATKETHAEMREYLRRIGW